MKTCCGLLDEQALSQASGSTVTLSPLSSRNSSTQRTVSGCQPATSYCNRDQCAVRDGKRLVTDGPSPKRANSWEDTTWLTPVISMRRSASLKESTGTIRHHRNQALMNRGCRRIDSATFLAPISDLNATADRNSDGSGV